MIQPIMSYKPALEQALRESFSEFRGVLPSVISPQAKWALSTMEEYSLRPGKRVRALLAVATAMHDDTVAERDALKIGCVVELMHDYLLIVDDVMDQSALRRGKPTVHLLYKAEYGDEVSEFEAEMVAINVGLLVQHMASWLLGTIDTTAQNYAQLCQIVHTNIAVTGLGQIDDTYQQLGRNGTSVEDITRKYQQKSGYYSFINPLQAGLALCGKHSDRVKQVAEAYGLAAGVAFQLNDDYDGLFGKSEVTGKENLDDIRDGKFTLLIQQGLERGNDEQRKTLTHLLGNREATTEDLETVRDILTQTGAADYVRDEARKQAAVAAKVARDGIDIWGEAFAKELEALAQTILGSLARG
ncbi:MAG TPA: polyprenyl synthetase family protein [Candidatus Saccharibacteria bacterium]|nr:polyprenyl synthetase family protein [Candidatus Saccharibacteria bacterium]